MKDFIQGRMDEGASPDYIERLERSAKEQEVQRRTAAKPITDRKKLRNLQRMLHSPHKTERDAARHLLSQHS